MRSNHGVARHWLCAGLGAVCLAIMAGAGNCCYFIYTLSSTTDADGPAPKCKAGQLVCQCEKATAPAVNQFGAKKLGMRLAECKCFQSPSAADYTSVACSSSPGPGWVAMRPPMNPGGNPEICCWVRLSSEHNFMYFQLTSTIERCEGEPCKKH